MPDIMSSNERSHRMSLIRGKDTKIEVIVRKYLFSQGYRYRKNVSTLPGSPDIVLSKYKTVIFINGCFWHRQSSCKRAQTPRNNSDFWNSKFEKTVLRDEANYQSLKGLGWNVIVLWECEIKEHFDSTMSKLIDVLNKQLKK